MVTVKKNDVLSLVTGGANGLGEHNRSLMTDVAYTPKPGAHRSLSKIAYQLPQAWRCSRT